MTRVFVLALALACAVLALGGQARAAGCGGDDDCKGGRTCINSVCTSVAGCSDDNDCKAGRVCSQRRCMARDAVTGGGCRADSDCKGDRVCDTGRCVSRAPAARAPAESPPQAAPRATPQAPSPPMTAPVFLSASPQPASFALVIGIEKYRDVPPPNGARSDAEKFAQMARQTLGIPESRVIVALDDRATKSDIEKHLDWLKSNVPAGSRIYFFFSGHGAPEPSKGTSYLLPYDGDPRFLERTALAMGDVLKALNQTKAREVLAMVDTCFSGAGGRSVLPPGARALVRVQAAPVVGTVALLSASSGTEISGPVAGVNAGLFTQHLLDGLGQGRADINGDGQISLRELTDYVKPRVARDAKRDNRDQNPNLTMGSASTAESFIVEWGLANR